MVLMWNLKHDKTRILKGEFTMIKIDMWYGNKHTEADNIDICFYDNECKYRGNIYKDGKIIGDYVCTDSVELEKKFTQLIFNWDR